MEGDVGANQVELRVQIERIFETATSQDFRRVEKRLVGLIAQLQDVREQKRYQMALDALPDMLKHLDFGQK